MKHNNQLNKKRRSDSNDQQDQNKREINQDEDKIDQNEDAQDNPQGQAQDDPQGQAQDDPQGQAQEYSQEDDQEDALQDAQDNPQGQAQDNPQGQAQEYSQEDDQEDDPQEYDQEYDQEDDQEYDQEDDQEYDQDAQGQYDDSGILDSIAIARETYFFTYEQDNLEQDELDILKFIYEQVANIYRDISLLRILSSIKHYYQLIFPEYERIFNLFYLSVYSQAVMVDRRSAGIININSSGNEITNSYTNILNTITNMNNMNNMNNPLFDISFNRYDSDLSLNNYINQGSINNSSPYTVGSSSLLNEIMFLSTVFNMRSNESLLNIVNLMNQVMDSSLESNDARQTSTQEQIKELGSQIYDCVGTDFKEKNSDFCTICQENYEPQSTIKILPCGHFFHCECIEPWLLNCSNLCPICRKRIN